MACLWVLCLLVLGVGRVEGQEPAQIAFTSELGPMDDQIFLINADGSDLQQLTSYEGSNAAPS